MIQGSVRNNFRSLLREKNFSDFTHPKLLMSPPKKHIISIWEKLNERKGPLVVFRKIRHETEHSKRIQLLHYTIKWTPNTNVPRSVHTCTFLACKWVQVELKSQIQSIWFYHIVGGIQRPMSSNSICQLNSKARFNIPKYRTRWHYNC